MDSEENIVWRYINPVTNHAFESRSATVQQRGLSRQPIRCGLPSSGWSRIARMGVLEVTDMLYVHPLSRANMPG